jgi:uncharacterized protein YaaN involved in tellurite resistance
MEDKVKELNGHIEKLEKELAANKKLLEQARDAVLKRINELPPNPMVDEAAYKVLKTRLAKDLQKP